MEHQHPAPRRSSGRAALCLPKRAGDFQALEGNDAYAVVHYLDRGRYFEVTAWSPGAELRFGWTAEEALGRPGSELVNKPGTLEGLASLQALRDALRDHGDQFDLGAIWYAKHGRAVLLDTYLRALGRGEYAGVSEGEPIDPARISPISAQSITAYAAALPGRAALHLKRSRIVNKRETPKQRRKRILAYHLRRLRDQHALTQDQVARELGTHPEHVSRWESEVWEPNPEYVAKLARLFNVDEYEFYRPIPDTETARP